MVAIILTIASSFIGSCDCQEDFTEEFTEAVTEAVTNEVTEEVTEEVIQEVTQEEYNKIITLILTQYSEEAASRGCYNIVNSQASLGHGMSVSEENIQNKFIKYGYDYSRLVEALFERNTTDVILDIPSSPESGYIIDYDETYIYSGQSWDPTFWENLRRDNPDVSEIIEISLPVYDPKTGIVLLYFAPSRGPLYGFGSISAYEYENGEIKLITRVGLWES